MTIETTDKIDRLIKEPTLRKALVLALSINSSCPFSAQNVNAFYSEIPLQSARECLEALAELGIAERCSNDPFTHYTLDINPEGKSELIDYLAERGIKIKPTTVRR